MTNNKRVPLWRNTVTLGGATVVIVSLLFIVGLLFFDIVSGGHSPYLGLLTFMILPGTAAVGVVLMGAGVVLARWRHRRRFGSTERLQNYPRIDLNRPDHRRALMAFGLAVALAVPFVGVLSYEGYHYTESQEFCGLTCHTVMEPQYTAYSQSPHASVECSECHIGPGASWYVKSKLSGLRQVLAVFRDSFPRPIPPAIQELRPATETCRQCHWPAKFFGDQLITVRHFASDESNTLRQLRMFIKTGGSDRSTGPPSGIHWHMALGFTIEYIAVDEHLQEIPWVRTVDHNTGEERIYRSDGKPHTAPPPAGTRRVVDCMDCHNRPTHIFNSPDRAVDVAFNVDPTLASLPFAKREAVRALVAPYATKADGFRGVPRAIGAFYEQNMPEISKDRRSDIERLKRVAREIYRVNFFPEMNVDWRTYPDNIGHKIFPGCFRCHEGRHIDDAGNTLSHECGVCHEFLTPRSPDDPTNLVKTSGFVHPIPLEGVHGVIRCDRCHTGGVQPSRTCEGCHAAQHEFRAGTLGEFARFDVAPDVMFATVTCDGCHDLSKPTDIETINETCLDCHDDDEERFDGMLEAWRLEVDQMLNVAETHADERGRRLLRTLRSAGPMHNMDATRRVLRSLGAPPKPLETP